MPALRKDTLTVVIIGLGSALFSFGAMALYREPPPREALIELTARPATEPRELLARRSGAGPVAPQVPVETSAAEPAAAGSVPRAETAPASPAPAVTAAPSAAPSRPSTSPAPAPAVAAVTPALVSPATPSSSPYRVRIAHVHIDGVRREVHDFTSGVAYTGSVENFSAPGEPAWVRRAEGKTASVRVEDFTSPGTPAWVRRASKEEARR